MEEQLTEEQKVRIRKAQSDAAPFDYNVNGERKNTSQNTESNSNKTTTELAHTNDSITTKEGYKNTSVTKRTTDENAKKVAQEQSDATMQNRGFVKNENGEWVKKHSSVEDLFGLKNHAEQVEKLNRQKSRNAGLFNVLTTLSDMITASGGGNVYKREKNDIAEKASQDTIARRDSLVAAEQAAHAKDRQDLIDALKDAQVAYDKYIEMYSPQETTQDFGKQSSSSTQNYGAKTTKEKANTETDANASERKNPKSPDTMQKIIHNADGNIMNVNVDKQKVYEYHDAVMRELVGNRNPEFVRYAVQKGWYDVNNGRLITSANVQNQILSDPDIYRFLSPQTQLLERKLYYDSEEHAREIYGREYRNKSELDKAKRLEEIDKMIEGNANANNQQASQVQTQNQQNYQQNGYERPPWLIQGVPYSPNRNQNQTAGGL